MFRPTTTLSRNATATVTTAACFTANQQQQQQQKKLRKQRALTTLPTFTTTTTTPTKKSLLATRIYRNDPYNCRTAIIIEREIFSIPENTLHRSLENLVRFIPYPDREFIAPRPTIARERMSRLFLGQLPYNVTDMQLQWLCYNFGNQASVYFPERIMKKDPANPKSRISTGCIHCYCHPDDVEKLVDGLNKRLLVDDTGVWHATTETEKEAVFKYTAKMKKSPKMRPQNRPYDSVVVQHAVSTFVPKPPVYNGPKVPVLAATAAAAFKPAADAPAFTPAAADFSDFRDDDRFNNDNNNNNFKGSHSNGSVCVNSSDSNVSSSKSFSSSSSRSPSLSSRSSSSPVSDPQRCRQRRREQNRCQNQNY